jgi:hypothetical protein
VLAERHMSTLVLLGRCTPAATITPLFKKVIATGDITLLKVEDIGF